MLVKSIAISNYKSIKDLVLTTDAVDGKRAFPYMGINEAGKTSILEAVSLLNEKTQVIVDYKNHCFTGSKGKLIKVVYWIELNPKELKALKNEISEIIDFKDVRFVKEAYITVQYDTDSTRSLTVNFAAEVPEDYVVKKISYDAVDTEENIIKSGLTKSEAESFSLGENQKIKKVKNEEVNFIELMLPIFEKFIISIIPSVVLWRNEPKYLIPDQVLISEFILDPEKISIPLKNCFLLAGADDVKTKIEYIKNDSNQRKDFAEHMSNKVTSHIKKVWPEHSVEIDFEITDTTITTSIRDESKGTKSNRISPSQRSDGFKRMISFILNISADLSRGNLENTLLLLDEPENQIHPTGQEYLRNELVKISQDEGNIVLFATHSPYMVDRDNLSRVEHVIKKLGSENVSETIIEEIKGESNTFAEINFNIFSIVTTDYHNELYGFLHSWFIDSSSDQLEEEKRQAITFFDNNYLQKQKGVQKLNWTRNTGKIDSVSKHTFIRHCIHHPEVAVKNKAKFNTEELRESIEQMRVLKEKIQNQEK